MEQTIINGEEIDKEITLGEMRNYLLEWYTDGIAEHITKIEDVVFEDYDREMDIKDVTNNETIFRTVFHRHYPINDNTKVYLSGVVNEELRGIIGKIIELDRQSAAYKAQNQTEPQKGE